MSNLKMILILCVGLMAVVALVCGLSVGVLWISEFISPILAAFVFVLTWLLVITIATIIAMHFGEIAITKGE